MLIPSIFAGGLQRDKITLTKFIAETEEIQERSLENAKEGSRKLQECKRERASENKTNIETAHKRWKRTRKKEHGDENLVYLLG